MSDEKKICPAEDPSTYCIHHGTHHCTMRHDGRLHPDDPGSRSASDQPDRRVPCPECWARGGHVLSCSRRSSPGDDVPCMHPDSARESGSSGDIGVWCSQCGSFSPSGGTWHAPAVRISASAPTTTCRRCSECTGENHHWLEHCEPPEVDDGIDTGFAGFVCKHCDARAEMCDDCTDVAEPGHVCEDEGDDSDPPQDSKFVKYRMETFEKKLARRPLRPLEHSRICREVEEMAEHIWRTAYIAGRRAGVEVAAERLEQLAKLFRGLP